MSITQGLTLLANRAEGVTSNEAATTLAHDLCSCSGILAGLWRKGKLRREVDRLTIANKKVYRYFGLNGAAPVVQPTVPRKPASPPRPRERVLETPVVSFDDLVSDLVDAMAGAVVQQLKVKIAEKMQAALPAPQRTIHAPEVLPPKPTLPVVLVIGLLPGQAGMIHTEFHEAFEMRFWGVEENYKRLDQLVEHAAHILLMTSKVNHKVSDHLKGHTVKMVNGGMSQLRSVLTEIFVEGT